MPGSWRIAVLAVVAAFVAFCAISVLVQLWMPALYSGIGVNDDLVVIAVEPHSSAARAGVVVGDRVLRPVPSPRTVVRHLRILHNGAVRHVTVLAEPTYPSTVEKLVIVGHTLTYILFVAVGSMLVLLRPSRMTWAFYVYCVGWYNATIGIVPYSPMLPSSGWHWVSAFWDVAAVAGLCGLLLFALSFPNNRVEGWPKKLEVAATILPIVLLPACILLKIGYGFGLDLRWAENLWVAGLSLMYGLAAAVVIATFARSRGQERHRIAWTLALPVSLILLICKTLTAQFSPSYGLWLSGDIGVTFAACVPLAVAYALIRYRVFDVTFVIGRALLYGTLCLFIAAMFGAVDWLLSEELISSGWGLALGIGAALAIGFSFSAVHKRLSTALDMYIFRMRKEVNLELERLGARLYFIESLPALYDLLLTEITHAVSAVNAAFFEKVADGGFFRKADSAWSAAEAWHLLADHHLARELNRKLKAIRVEDEDWYDSGDVCLSRRPALAVPLISNHQIRGIIFYGPHVNGTDFDPAEIAMIETIARQASPIYDALRVRSASLVAMD